ncbi:uncharacterized protein LOC135849644 [Planococcus citri]|uniref:uncharacterized protein LOC135849644 n=1 Tax=Planococcus citri TaxID=170843 RepID=UPI0031F7EF61
MKEYRTKALRVTTPHSIDGNQLDILVKHDRCNSGGTGGEDAFNDTDGFFDHMLQFDLVAVPSESKAMAMASDSTTANDFRRLRQCAREGDGIKCASSTQCRIMTTSTSTAGRPTDTCEKLQQVPAPNLLQSLSKKHYEPADAHAHAQAQERNWSENGETCRCRCRFTRCNLQDIKHEKFLPQSVLPAPSTSICNNDRFCSSVLELVSGADLSNNWPTKMQLIKEAIQRQKNMTSSRGAGTSRWYNVRDASGNTALLVSGQKLLKEGCFDKVVELANVLLSEGSDVNVSNNENRTLLSYSIQYMDKSIRLTALLLNYGANVWPIGTAGTTVASTKLPLAKNKHPVLVADNVSDSLPLAPQVEKYIDHNAFDGCNSAFTWFLISIMKRLKLNDNCLRTMYLLAEAMGEHPELMRSHVMSTMFSHAKCYNVLGPVFLQIKLAMSPYWTQPQSLKYMCKSAIRKSVLSLPGRFVTAENMSSLLLPPSLESYVMLQN